MTYIQNFITVTLEVYANRTLILTKDIRMCDVAFSDEPAKFNNLISHIIKSEEMFNKMDVLKVNLIPNDTFIAFDKHNCLATAVQLRYRLNMTDACFNNIRIGDMLFKTDSSEKLYQMMYLKGDDPGIYLVRQSVEDEKIRITDRFLTKSYVVVNKL